jgi:hypothetical protein
MKLLITSVGSLLGQNVLDSIEDRRELIKVIGTNSIAHNPRNFRCDKVYIVHNTDSDLFHNEFDAIVEKENPDFILPGRDEDCLFLADYKTLHLNTFANKIPFGCRFIAEVTYDKYQSYLFCKENQLPFAETLLVQQGEDALINEFIERHGFPLIAKPRKGYASLGVYFVLNIEQLRELADNHEVLIQEYLGNPDDIFKHQNYFKKGIPLFFQLSETEQYAAQTAISNDGKVGEVFITVNTMVQGRAEYIKQIENPDIEKLVVDFSKVFYQHGWHGPLNFQLKPDKHGTWKVFELSPRLTGTSSARKLLGYDEFGILANLFIPEFKIPNLTKLEKVKGVVFKYLQDHILLDEDAETLKTNAIWNKCSCMNDSIC